MYFLRRQAAWGALAIGVLASAGCGEGDGQIELTNTTDADVAVQFEDDVRVQINVADVRPHDDKTVDEVSDNGRTVTLLGECYGGPIVVTYADGRSIDLEGPICGGQELLIGEGTAKLQASSTN